MSASRWLRDLPGVVLRDMPRYRTALAHSGKGFDSDHRGWISLSNRAELLRRASSGPGYECDWAWGSELRAAAVIPPLARRLFAAAFEEWPIAFADTPQASGEPQLSFVFAHNGSDRLAQLRQTIRAVFAQDIPCEVIVVDQSETPLVAEMPAGVRYRHLAKDGVAPGWYKSWAYNVGARLAIAPILVFHDGDTLPPKRYAECVVDAIRNRGYLAASLQRFMFYLNPADSRTVQSSDKFADMRPTSIFQNWKGGTIAVERSAFFAAGGYDESFVDWGGEDDEFFDRLADMGHCRSGFIPFVHLWHAPQATSRLRGSGNIRRLQELLALDRPSRRAQLVRRDCGRIDGPSSIRSQPNQGLES